MALQNDPRFRDSLLHHWTNTNDIQRAQVARLYGVADMFRAWPGMPSPTINNNYYPAVTKPELVDEQPATPAPAQKAGLLKKIAMTALIGTGLGTAGLGAFYGGYSLLKDQFKAPEVKPIDLQFKAKFEPDKGLQVEPVDPKNVPPR